MGNSTESTGLLSFSKDFDCSLQQGNALTHARLLKKYIHNYVSLSQLILHILLVNISQVLWYKVVNGNYRSHIIH